MDELTPDPLQLGFDRQKLGVQVDQVPGEAQHFTALRPERQDQRVRRVQRVRWASARPHVRTA
ncbi:hypothetical protein [Kitasatospora sp. GP82]|uniref:hypothetical protein n=1 Tax=Kitasatospora sp. GP82 TaxID=3035089 RepID=UPI00247532CE|nr:hypothetical protein [Kitasatospora sp. GP82]MDH6127921.1 hypothetical protein [Kitasatospora sp. GP82]